MPKCEVKSVANSEIQEMKRVHEILHTAGLHYHIIIHDKVMSMINMI